MLNVMEERDIQVRGYSLRLPLDVLVMASANPEDYTNRGRIIPRSGPVRRRDPHPLPARTRRRVAVIEQEADLTATVPAVILGTIARFTRYARTIRPSTGVPVSRHASPSPPPKPSPPRPCTGPRLPGGNSRRPHRRPRVGGGGAARQDQFESR